MLLFATSWWAGALRRETSKTSPSSGRYSFPPNFAGKEKSNSFGLWVNMIRCGRRSWDSNLLIKARIGILIFWILIMQQDLQQQIKQDRLERVNHVQITLFYQPRQDARNEICLHAQECSKLQLNPVLLLKHPLHFFARTRSGLIPPAFAAWDDIKIPSITSDTDPPGIIAILYYLPRSLYALKRVWVVWSSGQVQLHGCCTFLTYSQQACYLLRCYSCNTSNTDWNRNNTWSANLLWHTKYIHCTELFCGYASTKLQNTNHTCCSVT